MSRANYRKRSNVFLVLLLISVLASAGSAVAGFLLVDPQIVYFACAVGFLALALVFLLCYVLTRHKHDKAKMDDVEEIEGAIERLKYGESIRLDPHGADPALSKTKQAINKAAEEVASVPETFGVYDEDAFDEAVLNFLIRKETSLASLSYFRLVSEDRFNAEGPVEALLLMLKTNYGENCFYGRIEKGFAVFCPYVTSRLEARGKVKKTVQLYSYSLGEIKIAAKASLAFYPDISPRLLTASAIRGLVEASPMKVNELTEVTERYGYDQAEGVNLLVGINRLSVALDQAKTKEDILKALTADEGHMLSALGMSAAGIFLNDPVQGDYELAYAAYVDPHFKGFATVAVDNRLPTRTIDPFYDWAMEEGRTAVCNDPLFLDTKARAILDSFSINRFACLPIRDCGRKIGLAYVAKQEKGDFTQEDFNRLDAYCRLLAHAGRKMRELEWNLMASRRLNGLLTSISTYVYAVKNYKLTYISENLKKAIPGAKIGLPCHKALFGSDTPCTKCPLRETSIEKAVPRLGSGTYGLFAHAALGETEIIVSARKEDFSSSRIDMATGILNDRALHEDLQKEILLKRTAGQILAFRVRNAVSLARQFRLEEGDYEPILTAVSRSLISSSLDGSLYRNGEYGFAYLLPYMGKGEVKDLAESVVRALSGKLPIFDKTFEVTLDFALIEYPIEASNPFEMDSLLRILYEKADASSKGRLFDLHSENGIVVDRETYMKMKLEEFLRAGILPLGYSLFRENAGKRIAYLQVQPFIKEDDGNLIPPERLIGLSKVWNHQKLLAECEIRSGIQALGKKKKAFTASSLCGLIVPINHENFTRPTIELIKQSFRRYKANKTMLYLQIEQDDMEKEGYADFVKWCKENHIRLGLGSYQGGLSEEQLAPFLYVRFPSSKVYGKDKDRFINSLVSARQAGVSFLIDGVSSREEAYYLGTLSFHYGSRVGDGYVDEDVILDAFN